MSHFSTPIWFQYFSTAWTEWLENVGETNERTQFWVLSRKDESHPVKPAGRRSSQQLKGQPWQFEERRSATKTAMQTQVAPTCVSCWHVDVPIRDKRSRQHWDWDSWPTLELARLTSKHYDTQALMISAKSSLGAYMQKAGDCWDISPQIFFGFSAKFYAENAKSIMHPSHRLR